MENLVINKLKTFTKHNSVQLTSRGNSAIFIAFGIIKKTFPEATILIPDQGGWVSFKTYPKLLGMETTEVETKDGIIDLEDLKEKSKTASAFIFTSFAGYFVEQPLKEISRICHDNNCLVIEDASGAITDDELCNGNYSDMIVGSFGSDKPVNVGYGGFISVKDGNYFEKVRDILSLFKVHPSFYSAMLSKLEPRRLKYMVDFAEDVKKELHAFEIFHKDKRGINVLTENNPMVIKYCQERGYDYIICPNYSRLNKPAISVELKRRE